MDMGASVADSRVFFPGSGSGRLPGDTYDPHRCFCWSNRAFNHIESGHGRLVCCLGASDLCFKPSIEGIQAGPFVARNSARLSEVDADSPLGRMGLWILRNTFVAAVVR